MRGRTLATSEAAEVMSSVLMNPMSTACIPATANGEGSNQEVVAPEA